MGWKKGEERAVAERSECFSGGLVESGGFEREERRDQGFTLLELLAVIVLLSIFLSMVVPSVSAALTRTKFLDCQRRLEHIRRAKSGFIVDHLGYMSLSSTADWNAFNMYFWNPVKFHCPRTLDSDASGNYDRASISNLYEVTRCPYCVANPL